MAVELMGHGTQREQTPAWDSGFRSARSGEPDSPGARPEEVTVSNPSLSDSHSQISDHDHAEIRKCDKGTKQSAPTKASKKWTRSRLACLACRRRKIRCTGEQPECKSCAKSHDHCLYKPISQKSDFRTDYMNLLSRRLKRMEDRIMKCVSKPGDAMPARNVVRGSVKAPRYNSSNVTRHPSSYKRDADTAFGSDFGLRRQVAPTEATHDPRGATSQPEDLDAQLLLEGAGALPPKDIQEHLAEIFFENLYGQASVSLHKPTYMHLLRSDTAPPVLVLSVCAISARFSSHPLFSSTPNHTRGEQWARRAREIVLGRYEWPSMTILSCILILGVHEFGTCHGGRSWALGGQALRMAFALELHKEMEYDPCDASKKNRLSHLEREVRRRTMWACYTMDRFNSSGTGRPLFIKDDDIDIQLPIKENFFQLGIMGPTEDLNGEVAHPVLAYPDGLVDAKENMGVAAYLMRSVALWGKITLYLNQRAKEPSVSLSSLATLELDYMALSKQAYEFRDSLPELLKYGRENLHQHDTQGIGNQFIFFHIVTHMNVLALSKSAVVSPLSQAQGFNFKPCDEEARATAVNSARRISELFRRGERYRMTAPFLGYCAFLSSTVLIFALFSPDRAVPVSLQDTLRDNFVTTINFLDKMKRYWAVFGHMANSVRNILQLCAKKTSQVKPSSGSALNLDQFGCDRSIEGDYMQIASFPTPLNPMNSAIEQVLSASCVYPFDLVADGGFFHQASVMNVAAPVSNDYTNDSDILGQYIDWDAFAVDLDGITAFGAEPGSEDVRQDGWIASESGHGDRSG